MHDKLSVSGLCFPGRSAVEVLDAVAETGARHTTLQLDVVSRAGQAAVREHSQAVGVAVEALIGGRGPTLDDQATWPAARERLAHAVDTAIQETGGHK